MSSWNLASNSEADFVTNTYKLATAISEIRAYYGLQNAL
jgi:hypothetical protein